eukprot:scaffold3880_cov145-Skeletonema_menzelii.AAC.1
MYRIDGACRGRMGGWCWVLGVWYGLVLIGSGCIGCQPCPAAAGLVAERLSSTYKASVSVTSADI